MKKLMAGAVLVALLSLASVSAFGATRSVKWRVPSKTTLAIPVGGTVRWIWRDGAFHSVKGPGFKSRETDTVGFSYTHKFRTRGTFKIICGVHRSQMTTTVKVG